MRAEQTTERLMKMIAETVPPKTRMLTSVCGTTNQADTDRWIRVAESAGFIPMPVVSVTVEKAEREGVVVRASADGCWGQHGTGLQ